MKPFKCNFLCMARAADDADIFKWYLVGLLKNSATVRFSEGTIPLMAEITVRSPNDPVKLQGISFRNGAGMAKMRISDDSMASVNGTMEVMRETSNSMSLMYFGLCLNLRKYSMVFLRTHKPIYFGKLFNKSFAMLSPNFRYRLPQPCADQTF